MEKMADFAGNSQANFTENNCLKNTDFVGIFWANFTGKQSVLH